MKPVLFISVLLFLVSSVAAAADAQFGIPVGAQRYVIDSEQSFVRIAAKMCMPDLLKGDFGSLSGEVYLDERNLSNSRITLSVKTADVIFDHEFHQTDNIKDIVMSDKLLNAMNFPLISFTSREIIVTNSQQFQAYGAQSSVITATVKGELTLVGVTRPFDIAVTFHQDTGMTANGRVVAAFSAYGSFKRSGFGVNYGLDRVGIRRMGDEVMVMASITANRSE